MTDDDLSHLEQLFEAASLLPAAERDAFLRGQCGEDPALLERLRKMLSATDATAHIVAFGNPPLIGPAVGPTARERAGSSGERIGPYVLIEKIGEGGFGVVWLAEQREPVRRRVAIKIIKPGMDSAEVVNRFRAEQQALAMMNHPNVAKVFDAGTTERGVPYFVMEYVAGESVTKYCDRQRLTIRDRLELFATICDAVHHAHMKGLIHRDIKPTNVLVTASEREHRPVVIDFGVAKALNQRLTEATLFTARGQMIGTPEYMSPEQAEMLETDIDTRSDIYSLGVLLYELLTGSLPFDRESLLNAAYDEMRRIIREVEPPKPSTRMTTLDTARKSAEARQTRVEELARTLRRELEWIPLYAMRKDRTRRYQSASELAGDVRSYLNGTPLIAAPESAVYQLRKWLNRHRWLLLIGVVSAGVPISLLGQATSVSAVSSLWIGTAAAIAAMAALMPASALLLAWVTRGLVGKSLPVTKALKVIAWQAVATLAIWMLTNVGLLIYAALAGAESQGARVTAVYACGFVFTALGGCTSVVLIKAQIAVSWIRAWAVMFVQGIVLSTVLALCAAAVLGIALLLRATVIAPPRDEPGSLAEAFPRMLSTPNATEVALALQLNDHLRAASLATSIPDVLLAQALPPSILNPQALNDMASAIATQEVPRGYVRQPGSLEAARRWAESACVATDYENPVFLSTLARIYWEFRRSGASLDYARDKAVELQAKAVRLLDEPRTDRSLSDAPNAEQEKSMRDALRLYRRERR
jgi:serine/threonine protein kinase